MIKMSLFSYNTSSFTFCFFTCLPALSDILPDVCCERSAVRVSVRIFVSVSALVSVPANFSYVSSAKNIWITSPAASFSLPSAFLRFNVIFFLRSILYKKLLVALGRHFTRYLSNRCPASRELIVISFTFSPFYRHFRL